MALQREEHEKLCDPNVKQFAGYYHIKDTIDKNYFYWFFESRNDPSTDPFIIWLTGGPGCSSILALLAENGPCTVNADGETTTLNPFSWNSRANIMWIDQPAGVGFSYDNSTSDQRDHDEPEVAEDLFKFLQEFFERHPKYREAEFYVFGESYGGHYVPSIGARIHQGNLRKEGHRINLHGLGIGNGLTDPFVQYQFYAEMAYHNAYGIEIISYEQYKEMLRQTPECLDQILQCQTKAQACTEAFAFCQTALMQPILNAGFNPYDITKKCPPAAPGQTPGVNCYDFSHVEKFMARPETHKYLNVRKDSKPWAMCNFNVTMRFTQIDWMTSVHQVLPGLLDAGIKVLVYAGDADYMVNWMGDKQWTIDMTWEGKDAFDNAPDVDWLVPAGQDENGEDQFHRAGKVRTANGLTFLQVHRAGHMVPFDQPEAALDLVTKFTHDTPFDAV